MSKALKIRDLSLRDAQQRLFGGRMTQEQIRRLLPLYRDARFHIVEVWGGRIPAAMMASLGESPWERLRLCASELDGISLLSAVSQGKAVFGGPVYPDYVIDNMYKEAFRNGINVMRVEDVAHEAENLREAVLMIVSLGAVADPEISLLPEAPDDNRESKKRNFLSLLFGSGEESGEETIKEYSDEYYISLAKELEQTGAGIITVSDTSAGVGSSRLYSLIPKLKQAVKIPIDFNTRYVHGKSLGEVLTAIIKGVDVVDCCVWWFSGISAAPPVELIWLFCRRLDIELDVDMEAIGRIRDELRKIRLSLMDYDACRFSIPRDFEQAVSEMPGEIDALFDKAIAAATDDRQEELYDACRAIETYFGFPSNIPEALVERRDDEEFPFPDEDHLPDESVRPYCEPANPDLPEFGGVKLARTEEEFLLLELLPEAAGSYLRSLREQEFRNDRQEEE